MKRGRSSWAVALAAALGLGVLIPTTAPRALAADDEDQGTQKRVEIITDDPRDSNDSGDGYLGVQVQDLTRSLQRAMDLQGVEGALVNRVEEDSPADKAGIQKGDVVVRLGRADTPGADDLTTAVRSMKPGTRTTITVIRDGARKSLDLVVGSRPEGETPETPEMPQMPPMPDLRGMGRVSPDQMHMYQDMIRQRQDMSHQMEELKAQISRLADEIRELRRELARRPIQER